MFYLEFEQRIAAGSIMEGDFVWVTSYYRNLPLLKPCRHVPPTFVQVRGNHDIPTNKNALVSGYHFRPCGKSGRLLSKVILPYEGLMNLGVNSNAGSLEIFLTEKEAKDAYVVAAASVKADIVAVRRASEENFSAQLSEVDERLAKIR